MNLRNLLASAAVATATLAAATGAMAASNTDSKSANGTADIIQPLTVTLAGGDLAFGTIVRPASGGTAGVVTITNTAGTPTRAATNDVILVGGSSTTAPDFAIAGESGSNYSLAIGGLTLTGPGAGNTVAVTLVSTLVGATTATINGAGTTHRTFGGSGVGNLQTDHLYVGGSIPVSANSTSGHYAGSFTVTATYE